MNIELYGPHIMWIATELDSEGEYTVETPDRSWLEPNAIITGARLMNDEEVKVFAFPRPLTKS